MNSLILVLTLLVIPNEANKPIGGQFGFPLEPRRLTERLNSFSQIKANTQYFYFNYNLRVRKIDRKDKQKNFRLISNSNVTQKILLEFSSVKKRIEKEKEKKKNTVKGTTKKKQIRKKLHIS